MSDVVLYSYNVSPYAAKVRAALRYKGLPFREDVVHPLRRGVVKQKSGQLLIPILEDGDRVVHDSTRILAYLDEKYPDKPLLPTDPVERGRARLLEEWSDEGLRPVIQPVRWLIPMNFERTSAFFRSAYPAGKGDDLAIGSVCQFMRLKFARRYGPTVGFGSAAKYLNRLAEVLDYVDASIGPSGWLVGEHPTVADVALAGWISLLRDLDGWETVRVRRKVFKLVKTLVPDAEEEGKKTETAAKDREKESFEAETQAIIDASRLRRASKGLL